MLDLAHWLKEHIPKEDSSAGFGTGLVHGDYRVDNLVFHPTEVCIFFGIISIYAFHQKQVFMQSSNASRAYY